MVEDFQNNKFFDKESIGNLDIDNESNALNLKIEEDSIDGVITSPPYSFAINYAKNDAAQLEYFGYSVNDIKENMIGLHGKNKSIRLQNYFHDMEVVCSEVYRVLKPDKHFVMIIGSNTNQTGGIRLENTIIDSCQKIGFEFVKFILKPIKGIRNTMKDEYILFFKKV